MELMPYISGGIQGNLERDSGEMDQQSDLVGRLTHSSSSSSSSSPGSSPTAKQGEDRVRVYTLCRFGKGWIKNIFIFIVKCYCYMYSDNVPMLLFHYLVLPPTVLTSQPHSPTAADVFHDTAGWRHLETYMTSVCMYMYIQYNVHVCASV